MEKESSSYLILKEIYNLYFGVYVITTYRDNTKNQTEYEIDTELMCKIYDFVKLYAVKLESKPTPKYDEETQSIIFENTLIYDERFYKKKSNNKNETESGNSSEEEPEEEEDQEPERYCMNDDNKEFISDINSIVFIDQNEGETTEEALTRHEIETAEEEDKSKVAKEKILHDEFNAKIILEEYEAKQEILKVMNFLIDNVAKDVIVNNVNDMIYEPVVRVPFVYSFMPKPAVKSILSYFPIEVIG